MSTPEPRDEQEVAESFDESAISTDAYRQSAAGYPPDAPQGVDQYGTTAQEERVDEPLAARVAREEPDPLAVALDDEAAAEEEAAFERMVAARTELSGEERAAGSEDPSTQARTILEDSELRALEREVAPTTAGERRSSEEATPR